MLPSALAPANARKAHAFSSFPAAFTCISTLFWRVVSSAFAPFHMALHHSHQAFTPTSSYTTTLLSQEDFTPTSFCTTTLLRQQVITLTSFYANICLHQPVFTPRSLDTNRPLHHTFTSTSFTPTSFYTNKRLHHHTFYTLFVCTNKFLHQLVFTLQCFCFYTHQFSHQHAFTPPLLYTSNASGAPLWHKLCTSELHTAWPTALPRATIQP